MRRLKSLRTDRQYLPAAFVVEVNQLICRKEGGLAGSIVVKAEDSCAKETLDPFPDKAKVQRQTDK